MAGGGLARGRRADARGRASTWSPSASSPGRCSSRSRACTSSAGSTGCSTCSRERDRGRPGHRRPPPRRRGSSARTRRSLPVTADGVRLELGSRQHLLPELAGRTARRRCALAEQLAERYGDHPALAMWHVATSTAATARLLLRRSAARFRAWLRATYGDLDGAERGVGHGVLGPALHRLVDEIVPPAPRRRPRSTRRRRSTSSGSARTRCSSCYEAERDVLREPHARHPGHDELHGPVPAGRLLEVGRRRGRRHARLLPGPAIPSAPRRRDDPDLMRSLGAGQPWLLMEQATSARQLAARQRAQAARADAALGVPGARARSRRRHVLPVAGLAGRRREVPQRDGPHARHRVAGLERDVSAGPELAASSEIAGADPGPSRVLLGWDAWWALEGADRPATLDLPTIVRSLYRPFFHRELRCGPCPARRRPLRLPPRRRSEPVPAHDEALEALTAFVREEASSLAATSAESSTRTTTCAPRSRRRHAGGCSASGSTSSGRSPGRGGLVELSSGEVVVAHDWSEWLEPDGGEPVASYTSGVLAGAVPP